MNHKQYLAALKRLGLSPTGKATQAALGVGKQPLLRLSSGKQAVSKTVALLLAMYLKHGIPDD